MNTNNIATKVFELSRYCAKEDEALLMQAEAVIRKMNMPVSNYLDLEIATEVAWQVGDILEDRPRAESRWNICNIAKRIMEAGIIDESSEDIDEIISAWLHEKEGY
jgi:hypothetical protein